MSNPFEEISIEELDKLEKSLGKLRQDIRFVQLRIREVMEAKGWRPEFIGKLSVEGVPPMKKVGTPGG